MKISLDQITQSAARRPIDMEKVSELAGSIQTIGLINPITVTAENRLISGAHRLAAAKNLGWNTIECTVLDADGHIAELAEIDENLIRNELDMISVGELAIRRDEILTKLGLRAKCGDNQHTKGRADSAPLQTTKSIADEIGMSERSLKVHKQLARNLTPSAKEAVRKGDIPKRDAIKLARKTPEMQDEIAAKLLQGQLQSLEECIRPPVSQKSGENEWYTPSEYVEAARNVMGCIDLDPASSREANDVVKASMYYTSDEDGLKQEWSGRVFMNPPYSGDLIGRFIDKLVQSIEAGDVSEAVIIVNNATETKWFSELGQVASMLCFPTGRLKFWHSEKPSVASLQGQVIVYCGSSRQAFTQRFSPFGLIASIVKQA